MKSLKESRRQKFYKEFVLQTELGKNIFWTSRIQ